MGTVIAVGQQEFQGFRECRPEIRRYVLLSSVQCVFSYTGQFQ